MPERKIDTKRVRKLLKQLDLKRLFVEELNWAIPTRRPILIDAGHEEYTLTPIAEQGGMVVFEATCSTGDGIADRSTRLAVHQKLLSHAQEHILVFANKARTTTHWVWVERQGGKRVRDYHHRFHVEQPGDSLLQKLEGLAFSWDELDADGRATIVQAADRARAAFRVEKVTKRFYEEFKAKHKEFLDFIAGIEKLDDRRWYASVMLNRLMFLYFIQKKGFLAGDPDYLSNQFDVCRLGGVPFYRGFLVTLFFQGLGMRQEDRPAEVVSLLGKIPYLDGGLFMPHQVEQQNDGIDIPDEAFKAIFAFFSRYQWHLDSREEQVVRADNEINPDVLGYIFEKYINQKEMGAYYTREDITEYITKNTVLPFLFDKLKGCGPACEDAVTPLHIADIEGYVHDALRTGLDLELPAPVAAGLSDVAQRGCWNQSADPDYALPTETWREHVARRQRVAQIREDFAAGKIAGINDFITYNLDIIAFTHDFLAGISDPSVLHAFYFRCLKQVTILDPTCGSGAFLFAALNLLESLYEISIERMEEFTRGRAPWKHGDPEWVRDFQEELASLARHPSRAYFVYKSIIVQNLYGVDIMQEAVEICKLRLFLKLAAQVEPDPAKDNWGIEPLPDIDFNILCGNTLVGYVRLEDIDRLWATVERDKDGQGAMAFEKDHSRLQALCDKYGRMLRAFRDQQLGLPTVEREVTKTDVQRAAAQVRPELNKDLWRVYRQAGLVPDKLRQKGFEDSHQPLHWVLEFPAVMAAGGFDAVIGNPPYVEYRNVRSDYQVTGYASLPAGDLYGLTMERSIASLRQRLGYLGMIVPVSSVSTDGFEPLRSVFHERLGYLWCSSYAERPSKLFDGVEKRLAIILGGGQLAQRAETRTAKYHRWLAEERPVLFARVEYARAPLSGIDPRGYFHGAIPKVSTPVEVRILRKLFSRTRTVEDHLDDHAPFPVYYTRKLRYFVQFFDFVPEIRDEAGALREPSELKELRFRRERDARVVLAALNSSLFFWFLVAFSDNRNLNRREILAFPLDTSALTPATVDRLCSLATALMDDFTANSQMLTMGYQMGALRIQSFQPRLSKPIIDDIDRELGEHYGLDADELDFVVAFDAKYRLGGDHEDGTTG